MSSRPAGDGRPTDARAGVAPESERESERGSGPMPVLALDGISKSFPGVKALDRVALRLYPGQVTALVGENGAGKSTMVKILAGVHQPDSGDFLFDGHPIVFRSPAESKAAGVSVIYQEPTLFPDLSVTENIFMGRQLLARGRRIDRHAMYAEAERLFDRLGVRIDPRRPAEGLRERELRAAI